MALLLAFTFPVKAKAAMPSGNEIGLYNQSDDLDFKIISDNVKFLNSDYLGITKLYEIEQMVVGQEITITISPIPRNKQLGKITCSSFQRDVVEVQETSDNPNVFTLKALKESNTNFITIDISVQLETNLFRGASIRINKVISASSSGSADGFTLNICENPTSKTPNWKSLEEKGGKLDYDMTIGGSGVDFKITPTTLNPEITPSDSTAISITPKDDGVWHIKANQEAENVKVTIKVDEIEKSFTIKRIKNSTKTGSGNGSSGGGKGSSGNDNSALNEQISDLQTKNEQLSKENDSLKEKLKSKEEEYKKQEETIENQRRRIDKYDFEEIDLVYTALIAFGATLLLSILIFVIIYNKKKRSVVNDLYNANYQITTLEERLKNIQTNNIDTNNSKIKVYENEIIKLKKELEDARMDLYKLQQQQTTPPSPAPAPTPAPEPVPTPAQISVEPEPPLSVFLYADNIIDGCLNKVVNMPDIENTIYELVLDNENASTARVRVYDGARPRILRYPTFLEGCEMQILNSNGTIVDVVKEGVATKDNNGNWVVTTPPMIEIR